MPAVGSRCWRDRISPETGATVLNLVPEFSDTDPLLELAYDEGGSGWWPRSPPWCPRKPIRPVPVTNS